MNKLVRDIPVMIENAAYIRNRIAVANAEFVTLLTRGHQRVSTLGDKSVKLFDFSKSKKFHREWKKQISIVVTRFVGNNSQNSRSRAYLDKRFLHNLSKLVRRQVCIG